MSKVNEYMPTPLSLDCFCQQCCRLSENQSGSGDVRKKHTYQLYSVIMHLGATMASGHYVAYVRATDPTTNYSNCSRDKRKTASLVSTSKSGVSQNGDKPRQKVLLNRLFKGKPKQADAAPKNNMNILHYYGNTCRSLECCGVRVNRSLMPSEASAERAEPVWLECDDETIRVLTKRQFEEVLAPKQAKTSALTPYLLFYVRDP